MTEQEWLACSEPAYMAATVPFSARKHRLFAVACCRRVTHLIHDKALRSAVDVAERFADGMYTKVAFARCESQVRQQVEELKRLDPGTTSIVMRGDFLYPETYAAQMVGYCLSPNAMTAAGEVPFSAFCAISEYPHDEQDPRYQPEFAALGDLVRDIFGNPFRPVSVQRSWLTLTVTGLAQAIYDDRQMPFGLFNNQLLAILADALEDAGCDNADILGHLRGGGDHIRGCWVTDLLLGKE